jgi:aconitate hydratase
MALESTESYIMPGKTLLGSDSPTCAAGSLGMLAIGAGGLEVAQAMAGEPFYLDMPKIWGVRLTGELSDWVSAKDVILEMLVFSTGDTAKNQRSTGL